MVGVDCMGLLGLVFVYTQTLACNGPGCCRWDSRSYFMPVQTSSMYDVRYS